MGNIFNGTRMSMVDFLQESALVCRNIQDGSTDLETGNKTLWLLCGQVNDSVESAVEQYKLFKQTAKSGREVANDEVSRMYDGTNKIACIKYYRSATGLHLREAKEAVEAIIEPSL